MEENYLNFVLVPLGLLMMVGYHVWLFYQIRRNPVGTVIGMNAINRRFWAIYMMEDTQKTGVLAVQTLRNNIMASTLLASTAIMLSSLIAVLMTGGVTGRGSAGGNDHQWTGITYNQGTKLMSTIKYFSILVCFLVSFLMNVQSIRYYSHASMLINVPYKNITNFTSHRLTADYIGSTVNRGGYFWSLGLRAFYFSFPLFLWLFGAIPMFICCIFMVFMLYFLDVAFEVGWVADVASIDEETG
ncbi:uncharacterized protein LOC111889812 [Lactuca sativa]|uniref:uncharacterized protein LOC111889812 n=1 Tax=Lactuca sativa TaxID=4236 RepID=UPI000CD807C9|nr:uncharacterized protein LOC111889812 [Lactuca sativa]